MLSDDEIGSIIGRVQRRLATNPPIGAGPAPPSASDEPAIRMAMLDACRRANASGLNQGTSGNISVRVADGFLVTPSALTYDDAGPDDVVGVAADGSFEGRRAPSSEWRLHASVLAARPDVGAVVHLHSPAATAVACLRRDIPAFHYMVAVAGGDTIRCAPYATFGSDELAANALQALAGRSACLLANHGQLALGADLDAAYGLAVEVEALAHQYLLARTVGEPAVLPRDEMARVLERFEAYRAGRLD